MATKIELTIAPDYVPTWGIVEAIRELFQNALDQQAQHPDNKMSWEYIEDEEKLLISNKTSVLTAKSLLLGATTKAKDVSTIGQFGEGYKIATLVLLRNHRQITFYNHGANEVWRPRFVKSRRFGTDVLTFFIERASGLLKPVPDSNLTIEVTGITPAMWNDEIIPSNLHLQTDVEIVESSMYGDAINRPGKVFVNGLYVCEYGPYKYGYNFKPEYIELDRDRKMVSDFDLKWSASRIWVDANPGDELLELIEEGAADVAYVTSMSSLKRSKLQDTALQRFRDTYGPNAIPVVTQDELELIPAGYRGVIVPDSYSVLIKTARDYSAPHMYAKTTREKLREWIENINDKYSLTEEELQDFDDLLEEL